MTAPASDELAILRLLARLAQASDDRDERAYRACLADRVQADADGSGSPVAASDYASAAITRVSGATWTHHQLSNPIVEIGADGDRASVLVDVVVTIAFTGEDDTQRRGAIGGRYDVGLVRSSSGWRVCRRILHQRYLDGAFGDTCSPASGDLQGHSGGQD